MSTTLLTEIPAGLINGVNKTFTVLNPISLLNLNGQVLTLNVDYTLTGLTISMVNAPTIGATFISYYLSAGTSIIPNTIATNARTVGSLKDGVAGLLTRTDLNSVTNLYNALERAFRTFQQKAIVPEAMTSTLITLYDGVQNYIAPSPIFGSSIKDIRPVGQTRWVDDMVYRKGGEDFDRQKNLSTSGYSVSFETENGLNIMRLGTRFVTPKIVLDPMSDISGWTMGGTLSGLAVDNSYVYNSPAALRMNLTGAGSGYIERKLNQIVDLTEYIGVANVFLALEIPVASLSAVELRLGSDASNYYVVSATQGVLGSWSTNDFLDTPFDLSIATKVGNPVITKIDYVRLTFSTVATMNNVRCGYLWTSLPSQHKVLFTTTGIFKAGNVISNFITTDTDIILLNDAAYNLYEHECAITVGLQEGGTLGEGLISSLNSILNGARARNGAVLQLGLYDTFKASNPSEEIRMIGSWWD